MMQVSMEERGYLSVGAVDAFADRLIQLGYERLPKGKNANEYLRMQRGDDIVSVVNRRGERGIVSIMTTKSCLIGLLAGG